MSGTLGQPGTPIGPGGGLSGGPDLTRVVAALQALVVATNGLQQTTAKVFPLANALPNYLVAGLPTGQPTGACAWATNGRKNGEGAAAGTGVLVSWDGLHWVAAWSSITVTS